MKRIEFGKTIKILKQYLKDEVYFGEDEIILSSELNQRSHISSPEQKLEKLKNIIQDCKKCPLGNTRLNLVFGTGNPRARVMFIGEGPGYEEDHMGEPFVGKAGQLLTKIIESIGLKREDVYIANLVKCHPMIDPSDPEKRSNDRPPNNSEITACLPYLEQQIKIINPEFICTLGLWATRTLLKTEEGISKLRGRFYKLGDIIIIPTYHPAALLRDPTLKRAVWQDMKMLKSVMKI